MTHFRLNFSVATGALTVFGVLASCSPQESEIELTGTPSPYLFIYAGDWDQKDVDFLAVLDADPKSATRGEPLNTMSTGMKDSMPHHMEYTPPPAGEPLFVNAHHEEKSLLIDVSALPSLGISQIFDAPQPFRFPHDYYRTDSGTRLVGFLRGEGVNLEFFEEDKESEDQPFSGSICQARSGALEGGSHGGIAEYSASGELLRTVSAEVETLDKAVRPYAFTLLPEADRFAVTSAPMTETSWAEVLQIYRYSDFSLLHTLEMPTGDAVSVEKGWNAKATGFGLHPLDDGSVFVNSFECSLYHLTGIDTDAPNIEHVHTIKAGDAERPPHACGIPVLVNNFWVQTVGKSNRVVVLDIRDPKNPQEVYRLETPGDFNPHWLSKDPRSNRLILGAELGGEKGFFVLRMDEQTGALDFDDDFNGQKPGRLFSSVTRGYISLQREEWPHGKTGDAWGHAALFLTGAEGG